VQRRPPRPPSNCEGTKPAATEVNGQIKQLAPVLNAPFADGLVESALGLSTMAKRHAGNIYVFAGRDSMGG
jgi:hypothetical protein